MAWPCIVRECLTGYPQTAAEKAEREVTNSKQNPELFEKWKSAL